MNQPQNRRPQVALLLQPHWFGPVLNDASLERLRSFAEVVFPRRESELARQAADLLAEADGCVLSWGSPRLDASLLAAAPRLKILAYAAGSVRGVVSPELYDRGIVVTSSAAANGEEVASYALGAALCALKGVFQASRTTRAGGWGGDGADVFGRTAGIIGAGYVGREMLRMLAAVGQGITVLLYDPYVSPEDARSLGAANVGLEDLLARSDVVSLHAPSIPATRHMLHAGNLRLLKDHATLVNTARGALVDPDALVAELTRRPTLQAVLDVTDPLEPPPPDHPFRTLPNVVLTPHLAGAVGAARVKLGELAVEELYRFFVSHEPPLHPVTEQMLDRVA